MPRSRGNKKSQKQKSSLSKSPRSTAEPTNNIEQSGRRENWWDRNWKTIAGFLGGAAVVIGLVFSGWQPVKDVLNIKSGEQQSIEQLDEHNQTHYNAELKADSSAFMRKRQDLWNLPPSFGPDSIMHYNINQAAIFTQRFNNIVESMRGNKFLLKNDSLFILWMKYADYSHNVLVQDVRPLTGQGDPVDPTKVTPRQRGMMEAIWLESYQGFVESLPGGFYNKSDTLLGLAE
jgi:hypothetical protein